jgi:hypothetical protein
MSNVPKNLADHFPRFDKIEIETFGLRNGLSIGQQCRKGAAALLLRAMALVNSRRSNQLRIVSMK